jgi:hypothetical protein
LNTNETISVWERIRAKPPPNISRLQNELSALEKQLTDILDKENGSETGNATLALINAKKMELHVAMRAVARPMARLGNQRKYDYSKTNNITRKIDKVNSAR